MASNIFSTRTEFKFEEESPASWADSTSSMAGRHFGKFQCVEK
jgi:hypothetical protein